MRCYDLIDQARTFLNDPLGQFYADAVMLQHANRALREVSNRALTLREVAYSGVVKDQAAYGLPRELLRIERAAFLHRSEWEPLVRTQMDVAQWLTHEQTFSSDRPYYFNEWGRGRVEKYQGGVRSASGLHLTLDDPVHGILVGDHVLSVTDGSEATVTEVVVGEGSTTVSHTAFTGGTRSTLVAEDGDVADVSVRIVSHNVFPFVIYIVPPPTFSSEVGEEPLWVYMIRTHYTVTQALMDAGNDELEIDLELETCALYRLLYWASLQEAGPEDSRTMKYQTDYETEFFKQRPYISKRIHEFESAWGTPGTARWSRTSVELTGVTPNVGHILNRGVIA